MFTKTLAAAIAGLVAIGALGATTTTASAAYWGNGDNSYDSYNAYPGDRPHAGTASAATIAATTGPSTVAAPSAYFNQRLRPRVQVQPVVQKVCKPVYKTVQTWKPYYGWVWATVYGGQQCWFQPVYPSQNYSYGW